MSSKHCDKDKILNPKTGRCVLKSGKIGKELMQKKSSRKSTSKSISSSNMCTSNKILNPKTGRCVLKSGKLGKELLRKRSKSSRKSSSRKSSLSSKKSSSFRKSNSISESWDYEIIKKNTLLFRGSKTIQDVIDRATYFSPLISTANEYLPSNKTGHLCIYKTTQDLKLFKFDSINNINKLFEKTFEDKTKVYKNKTLYEILRHIFTNEWIVKDVFPYKVKRIMRSSATDYDILFSNWLCDKKFNGYTADIMPQKLGSGFPAEIMLCKPKNSIKLLKDINMRRTKNKKILDKILDEISL